MHQFGHTAHMNEIMEIAKKYNLYIIEDNAESIGAKYKGQLLEHLVIYLHTASLGIKL